MAPTAHEILARIAAATPWFPSQITDAAELEPVISQLWQAQLIEARDWVKGRGQGFGLTVEGEQVLKEPFLLPRLLSGEPVATVVKPLFPTTYDRGERARSAYYIPQRPVITQVLILLNILVFFVGLAVAWRVGSGRMAYLNGHDHATLAKLGVVSGPDLLRGDWWRLETASFVHIGFIHLLLNLYGLALVGSLAENLWGRWRFALIYLVAGLGGTTLAMLLRPGAATAGASGAIWGVMTSLVIWIYQYRQHFEKGIITDFGRRLGFAIVLNVLFSFLPNVSWQGHLGGAIGGALMAIALDWIRTGYRRRTRAGIVAACCIPVAMIATLLVGMLRLPAWRPLMANEARRHQAEYLQPLQADLAAIDQQTMHILFADTARPRNILQPPKLEKRTKDLQQTAEGLKPRIPSGTNRLARNMPEKLAAYCDAVIALCQRLAEYHVSDKPELSEAAAALIAVDERWHDLFHNRWMR